MKTVPRHYGQALRRGSKYAPQALPRLLTLWLDSADLLSKCGQEGEREGNKLHEAMETLVNKTVPAGYTAVGVPAKLIAPKGPLGSTRTQMDLGKAK